MMPSDTPPTYRVQPHAGFGFVQVAAVTKCLANLGISHLYCSSYLHAAYGSLHGYPKEVPDARAFDTFQRSTLDWGERHRELHTSLLVCHRRLIQLLDGRPDRLCGPFDEQAHGLVVEHGVLTVACSLGLRAQYAPVQGEGSGDVLLMSNPMIEGDARGLLRPADSVVSPETAKW